MGRVTAMPVRKVALLALVAVLPAIVPAQQRLSTVRVHVPAVVRNNARADTLDARAEALYGLKREWRSAAQLHRRAGQLRGDDPRSVQSFRMAAWMYSAAKDLGMARRMMVSAAERAAGAGYLEQAAGSYVDAAYIAVADNDIGELPSLLRKTRLLVDGPLFPADRRASLLERIVKAPQIAAAWEGTR